MDVYRRAMAYFQRDWSLICLLVFLIGVSVFVGLVEAWPVAVLIDNVLSAKPKGDWVHHAFLSILPNSKLGQIVGLMLIELGIQVLGYTTFAARMMINSYLSYRGTALVRTDLFRAFSRLGLLYHRSRPQGDAIFRLTFDVLGPWGIMDIIIGTAVAAVTLSVMTVILLSRSIPLTLAAFMAAPLMVWSNWVFGRRIYECSLKSKQVDSELTSFTQQAIANMELSQAFRREMYELTRFQSRVNRSNKVALHLNWQQQLYPWSRDTILALSGAIIFGYGGYLVYRDEFLSPVASGMTVGTLLIFMDYVRKLWDPLKWLTEFVAKVQYHVAAARRVFEVIDTPPEVSEVPLSQPLPLAPRTLTIEKVRFSYCTGHPILTGISARIPPGEFVAFVGPSGTGKSTLLNLLLRFFDPTHGVLRLDHVDFRQLQLADLRCHMALVRQDCPLIAGTIAENIAYGRPEATRQDIAEAAEQAGAADFITTLPDGYDTLVAEGGQNLSGGQRQRLAIARALLTQAPILILDEPTSAVDPLQEALLMQTLASLRGQRTVILVTHRLESVVFCDQIFVLLAGRIVEHGTHAALLSHGGYYARMQRGELEPTPDRRVGREAGDYLGILKTRAAFS